MILSKAVAAVSFLLMAVINTTWAIPHPGIIRERHVIHAPIKIKVIHHYKVKKVPIIIKKHLHYYKHPEEIQNHFSKPIEIQHHSKPILEDIHHPSKPFLEEHPTNHVYDHDNEHFQFHPDESRVNFKGSHGSFQQSQHEIEEEDYEESEQSKEEDEDYEYE